MDKSVKMDRELTWRKKPQPISAYCGFPVIVDASLPADTVKIVNPDTGEQLAEIKITK